MSRPVALACVTLLTTFALAACQATEPAKQYAITGQVLAVNHDARELTIKHEDIQNFMPGMTMSFPVSDPALLAGRTPGELVQGTLEVSNALGRLVALTHVGTAPLPSTNEAALAAGLLGVGDVVPDAAFIDQTDSRRTLAEWRGSFMVLTFIYTRCPVPNFCPLMEQNFATLQRQIAEDAALRGRVRLVSITFDPVHDTPAVLATRAAARKADPAVWTFLTGDSVTVDAFAARFGVSIIRPEGAADIAHNLRTALVAPDGRVRKFYTGNDWTPGAVLADLRAATR